MLKLVDVKPLRWVLPLGTSFGSKSDGEFGYKQPMVCPAVCATHCLGHPYIWSIPPSGDANVYQVPVSGACVHQRRPISMGKVEYSVRDEHCSPLWYEKGARKRALQITCFKPLWSAYRG